MIGESLIDVIIDGDDRTEMPGGSPMNVAIGLARQGVDVAFVTDLGRDHLADQIELRLVTEGVDVYSPIRVGRRSSVALATIDPHGNASYEFDLTFNLDQTDMPENGLADFVHFGSIATVIQPGATHVDQLVEKFRPNALVSYDPNVRPLLDPDRDAARERVDRHASIADIVRASVDDLAHIHPELLADPSRRSDGTTERMIAAASERWLASGAALVAITDAERGVHLATENHRTYLPSNRPAVVDTVGAGDAFMAGLISGIDIIGLRRQAHRDELATIDLKTLRTVARWAQRTAEYTVGRVGAEPPTSVELLNAERGVRVA
ncbi:MAG: carbohydrate kinase family protein [Microcella sp.]